MEENKKEKASLSNDIYDVIEMFAIITIVLMVIMMLFIRTSIVSGPSMNDTLENGEILFVRSIGYTPSKGDIIVAQNKSIDENDPIVKRIIATAGDTISYDSLKNEVTVNGVVIDEPYAKYEKYDGDTMMIPYWDYPITIPDGYVFVMGDNRNNSLDSRSKDIGLIDERCIIGQVICNFKVPEALSNFILNK